MADSPLNRIEASAPTRPGQPGDLPERLRRRYLAERQGPAVAYFVDLSVRDPAFRDDGRRLSTVRNDPQVVRDLVAIARHRGWSAIQVRGQGDFRREVWLTARLAGLEVTGYQPRERDEQALARKLVPTADRPAAHHRPAPTPGAQAPGKAADQLRVVEAVVRARVADPADQDRILARTRERLATLLERDRPVPEPRQRAR